jgi:hypothetical protein
VLSICDVVAQVISINDDIQFLMATTCGNQGGY